MEDVEIDPPVDQETIARVIDLMNRLWDMHLASGFPDRDTFVEVGWRNYKRHRDAEPVPQADMEWLRSYMEELKAQ